MRSSSAARRALRPSSAINPATITHLAGPTANAVPNAVALAQTQLPQQSTSPYQDIPGAPRWVVSGAMSRQVACRIGGQQYKIQDRSHAKAGLQLRLVSTPSLHVPDDR
ncbi:hypothetical protein GQ53DRAFT_529065 [Thozetella sp. PMI_491]|nr:hypothetical protein GQ53DRAFT_529065 [Thozetella sp. PMI_491]